MTRLGGLFAALVFLAAGTAMAGSPSAPPTAWQRTLPAVVSIRTHVPADRPSVLTLGPLRRGTGVIIDPAGYILTVGYILVDADLIEVGLPDGRNVPARLVGLDLEQGFGLIRLEDGPWPAAPLGDSAQVAVGDATGTLGIGDDDQLTATLGTIREIRSFAGYWEYALDRAFIVQPANPAFGGSPVVNAAGEVIGIASLQLGRPPAENLAIPVAGFLQVKDELIAAGRVKSRKVRPWLGLYTAQTDRGVVVIGASPVGPAAGAAFKRGDVIVRINGDKVETQHEFYRKLWEGDAVRPVQLLVLRETTFVVISVKPIDRYDLLAPRER